MSYPNKLSLSIKHYRLKEKNEFIDYLYLSNSNSRDKVKDMMDFGYISYYYSKKDKSVSILHLFVELSYRNNGYGTLLIKECIKKCKQSLGNELDNTITLYVDDMSDRYLKSNNIYVNLGFTYVSKGDGPEMIGKF